MFMLYKADVPVVTHPSIFQSTQLRAKESSAFNPQLSPYSLLQPQELEPEAFHA